MLGSEIDEANRKAVDRVISAEALLVDMKPARNAIPGFRDNLITHSGPPISWEKMLKVQKMAALPIRVNESGETERLAEVLESYITNLGFKMIESHKVFVHRSLTREIMVYEKT